MKKLLPFIVLSLLSQSPSSSADSKTPLVKLLLKSNAYDTTSLLEKIDKNGDSTISYDELVRNKFDKDYSPYEKLVVSTLIKNYDRLSHLSSVKGYDGSSQLTIEDLQNYLFTFANSKVPIGLAAFEFIRGVNSVGDGLFPQGINSISHKNIEQGQFGDSNFIAALAAMAYTRPEEIYNMLTENQDGSFDVKSPITGSINVVPTLETVYIGASSNHHGNWPLALELSFLAWKNQPREGVMIQLLEKTGGLIYSFVTDLFYSSSDFSQEISKIENEVKSQLENPEISSSIYFLTGNPSRNFLSQMVTIEEIRKLLTIIKSDKRVAVASIQSIEYKNSCVDSVDIAIISNMLCKKDLSPSLKTLKNRHSNSYSILDYDSQNDTVLIKSSWGFGEPVDLKTGFPLDGLDDGIFELTVREFKEIFDSFTIESSYTDL